MMKRSVLALAVALGAITSFANAAEIYNKDGNKLDLYGRVSAALLIKSKVGWSLPNPPGGLS
ncbi:hypothetical protein AN664_0220835 [Serratia marcescens]|nr:hypothetical protein AN701_0221610 [Serratia marcescens]OCN15946.1 hypothetical protein AN699_0220185 [Serratia marcescens]OCN37462.1 hypothetical protein AN658_0220515 [Serratia marcescens]OCN38959.1 hypothetical protein AN660_0220760 [Serratia marcescens]OCN58943.1 hypothetical protein AN665_0220000 [Serratia marcescens]